MQTFLPKLFELSVASSKMLQSSKLGIYQKHCHKGFTLVTCLEKESKPGE
jgi:hypothetical protein